MLQPDTVLSFHRYGRTCRFWPSQRISQALRGSCHRIADARRPPSASGVYGKRTPAHPCCDRLPVRGYQPPASLRFRCALRPLLESDAASATGRPRRSLWTVQVVRSVLLYSPDSSIDGAVLQVVLRKAEAIRKATGVTVPLPEERSAVAGALLNALLLRKGRSEQLRLDLGIELSADTEEVDRRWRDAEEASVAHAVFAQNTLRPDEVIPEWQRWQTLLGGPEDVRRFLARAMGRLNAGLEPSSGERNWRIWKPCLHVFRATRCAGASGNTEGHVSGTCTP